MNAHLPTTLACAASLLAASGAEASRYLDVEQRAMAACMIAFVDQVMPDVQDRVRYVMPEGSSVFVGRHSYDRARMTLRAEAANSGGELASGICTVGRDSRVQQLTITFRDAARLAEVSAGGSKVVLSAR